MHIFDNSKAYKQIFKCKHYTKKKAQSRLLHKSLSNGKILDWSKYIAFTDDKITLAKMIMFVFNRSEKSVGKGEIAGYQNFLLSHNVFKSIFSQGGLKLGLCGKELNRSIEYRYQRRAVFPC